MVRRFPLVRSKIAIHCDFHLNVDERLADAALDLDASQEEY